MEYYESYDDKELLRLVRGNSEPAFRELYNRYYEKLLVLAFFKTKDHDEAEEIVQIVFVNLWKRRATIKIKFSFHTYIASVLKYEILAHFAKKKREELLKKNISCLYNPDDNSTENLLAYDQLRGEIEKTVRLLPEKCRLVFRLSREEGMTEKEICESLNIAPKTAQAHLSKALKLLRSSLNQVFFSFFF